MKMLHSLCRTTELSNMYVDATTYTTSKVINIRTKKYEQSSTSYCFERRHRRVKKINSRVYVRIGCARL